MSNVESLLTAILTRDAQYIVVPQSRVEELLLAIFNSGGGGGGGEGGVDEFARAELLKKVDKREGYALISTSEIERLAGVSNYNDAPIKALIDKKVTAKNGFSLIDDTDYANFKNLENYDDTAIKALINKKVDDTVTVAGLKITTNITAAQLATALELSTYVKKDGNKVLSTNDFTNDYKNQIDTNTTEIEKKVNKTSVSSANKTTSTIAITDNSQMAMVAKISGKTVKNMFNGYDDLKAFSVSSEKYDGQQVISANNVQWNGATFSNVILAGGKKYRFKAMVKTSNTSGKILTVWNYSTGSGSSNGVTPPAANTWFLYEDVGIIKTGDNGTAVRLESNVATNMSIACMTVTEEAVDYGLLEPGLNSAPVESVVSRSKNLFYNEELPHQFISDSGVITSENNQRLTDFIALGAVNKLTVKATGSGNVRLAFYNASKTFISRPYYPIDTSDTRDIASRIPSGAVYVRICADYNMISIALNEDGSDNKTTVLVPQSIRNLPDYGVENNIVDFENGTYTHNNTISNGAVTAYTGTDKVIPISDYLRPLPVENGGTITLVNEHNLDVNSTIKYKKEV